MKGWRFKITGLVIVLLLIAAVGYALRPAPIVQPIQFSHKAHLESEPPEGQEKIACKTCHKYYDTRTVAGRPYIKTCLSCHTTSAKEIEKKPELGKLLEFGEKGEEIHWKRIYDLPDHVFFSHRRHTRVHQTAARAESWDKAQQEQGGKAVSKPIKCEVCHGPMAQAARPPPHPLNDISMEFCKNCHQRQNVTVDCNACHH